MKLHCTALHCAVLDDYQAVCHCADVAKYRRPSKWGRFAGG